MVVGKNVSPALMRGAPAPKLPPLKALRVKRPGLQERNPCEAAMSSVLSCWASNGFTSQGCAAVESALRACVDAPKAQSNTKNRINSQLAKYYPQMKGPERRK